MRSYTVRPEKEKFYDAEVYDFEDVVVLLSVGFFCGNKIFASPFSGWKILHKGSLQDHQTVVTGLEIFA